jgi:Zn finger protein HypA/HybF involved in hydrogenase expression
MTKQKQDLSDRLVAAYNEMLTSAAETLQHGEEGAKQAVEKALEKGSELGELSREEAEKVGDYLKRDLVDAAHFLNDSGKELGDWLRFDIAAVEMGLGQLFSRAVDKTRVALTELELRANALGEWHSGEVVGIGTLQCKSCGEVIHFHHTSHIPPCPKCHGTTYRRLSTSDE